MLTQVTSVAKSIKFEIESMEPDLLAAVTVVVSYECERINES